MLVGLALVVALINPMRGVPPRAGTSAVAPAQLEVRVVSAGEFDTSPVGTVMEPTAFPAPGKPGGPTLQVKVRNISAIPVRVSVRLVGLPATLDRSARVRGSVAGSVILNGPLGGAAGWSRGSDELAPGQSSTLRMRFKLLDGIAPDEWRGRSDVRQLELRALRSDGSPASVPSTTPETTPATTPGATS